MKELFPPHRQSPDFLTAEDHAGLLAWTMSNQDRFKEATLIGGVLNPAVRVASVARNLGEIGKMLRERLTDAVPSILAGAGVQGPVEFLEIELAAHGDGAHFSKHLDIPVGSGRRPLGGDSSRSQDRIVSAVYYFHREPKGFTGGDLRIHGFEFPGKPTSYVDLPPQQNSLVMFPSWVPHEVLRVQCPSRRFEDSRFAVNCWLCRRIADYPSGG